MNTTDSTDGGVTVQLMRGKARAADDVAAKPTTFRATAEDYCRAIEEALADQRYKWGSPLGDLVQADVADAARYDDLDVLEVAVRRLTQYQKCVDHPDGGFVALASTHEDGGRIPDEPGYERLPPTVEYQGREYEFGKRLGDGGCRLVSWPDGESTVDVDSETCSALYSQLTPWK
jgi:hypothetical protein